jgi:propionyl-CoA carboxylase alpha chain
MMKRLLIANRGEIANRIIRTASRMGIETVAVFSDPDATQAFAAGADQAVALGGSTPGESYLDIDKILRAAAMSGADAVHPGYGFLSERADFARSVIDAGLIFVGSRPEAIASMGSKLEAKRIMGEAGVPLLPSAELGESLTDSELIDAGTTIGYPLLIKASAGGGGRGMRIVTASDGLVEAVQSARREAVSAFADGTV